MFLNVREDWKTNLCRCPSLQLGFCNVFLGGFCNVTNTPTPFLESVFNTHSTFWITCEQASWGTLKWQGRGRNRGVWISRFPYFVLPVPTPFLSGSSVCFFHWETLSKIYFLFLLAHTLSDILSPALSSPASRRLPAPITPGSPPLSPSTGKSCLSAPWEACSPTTFWSPLSSWTIASYELIIPVVSRSFYTLKVFSISWKYISCWTFHCKVRSSVSSRIRSKRICKKWRKQLKGETRKEIFWRQKKQMNNQINYPPKPTNKQSDVNEKRESGWVTIQDAHLEYALVGEVVNWPFYR